MRASPPSGETILAPNTSLPHIGDTREIQRRDRRNKPQPRGVAQLGRIQPGLRGGIHRHSLEDIFRIRSPADSVGDGRASDASNLGYTGYSGKYDFTVEGNAVFGITDWLFAAFEYRQKLNKYDTVAAGGRELIGNENDWWTVGLAAILSPHLTVTAGYGHLGTVLNTTENTAWAGAIKYEF